MIHPAVATFVTLVLYALLIAIFLRALMSWFPMDRSNPFAQMLVTVTEPILQPLRRIIPRAGMFDLSTMAAIILIFLMLRVVDQVS